MSDETVAAHANGIAVDRNHGLLQPRARKAANTAVLRTPADNLKAVDSVPSR